MMDWQEAYNLALNTRGYIVMGSDKPLQIGEQIKYLRSVFGEANHPFTIIAQTNYDDAKEQTVLWKLPVGKMHNWNYYYRVTTD